ncbi:MAG: type II toxin-antitoxin system RelE/ParE family toxin [Eubacteriales bacterium]
MKKYALEITDNALLDMEQIYVYIAHDLQVPENAQGQYDRIANQILMLESMPDRYPIMCGGELERRGIRLMPVDNYDVLYFIREEEVVVTDVIYSAANIRERFKGY